MSSIPPHPYGTRNAGLASSNGSNMGQTNGSSSFGIGQGTQSAGNVVPGVTPPIPEEQKEEVSASQVLGGPHPVVGTSNHGNALEEASVSSHGTAADRGDPLNKLEFPTVDPGKSERWLLVCRTIMSRKKVRYLVEEDAEEEEKEFDTEKRKKEKLTAVFGAIVSAIWENDRLADLVTTVKNNDGKGLWKAVVDYFGVSDRHSWKEAMAGIGEGRQKDDESARDFSNRLAGYNSKLLKVKKGIPEDMMVYTFLRGLHSGYRVKVEMLNSKEEAMTLIQATNEMSKWEQENSINKKRSKEVPANAVGVRERREYERSLRCFECNGEGHIKRDCPKRRPRYAYGSGAVCNYCKKPGHDEARCYKKKDRYHVDGGLPKKRLTFESNMVLVQSMVQNGKPYSEVVIAGLAQANRNKREKSSNNGTKTVRSMVTKLGNQTQHNNEWYLDSAAGKIMGSSTISLDQSRRASEVQIKTATDEVLNQPIVGDLTLRTKAGDMKIEGVLAHNGLKNNLLSVHHLATLPEVQAVVFEKDSAKVLNKAGQVMLEAVQRNGMYVVQTRFHGGVYRAMSVDVLARDETKLWHERLGHVHLESIDRLVKAKAVTGLEHMRLVRDPAEPCVSCLKGKAVRFKFGKKWRLPSRILELVVSDLAGPITPSSFTGEQYFQPIICVYSGYICLYTLAQKSEASANVIDYAKRAQTKHGIPIGTFHTDCGKEFLTKQLAGHFKSTGTERSTTMGYLPEHNPFAERSNRTIVESGRTMIQHAGATMKLWPEAVQEAVYVLNRARVYRDTGRTPFQIWNNTLEPTDISGIKVWGCDAFATLPKEKQHRKFGAKATKFMYVGHDLSTNGYKLLDVTTMVVTISRDVVFLENSFEESRRLREDQMESEDDQDFSSWLGDLTDKNELQFVRDIVSVDPRAQVKAPVVVAETKARGGRRGRPVKVKVTVEPSPSASPARDDLEQRRRSSRITRNRPPVRLGLVDPNDIGQALAVRVEPVVPALMQEDRWEIDPVLSKVYRSSVDIPAMLAEHDDNVVVPLSYTEAVSGPYKDHWQKAIDAELESLAKNGTWKLMPRSAMPHGRKEIGVKWVFNLKRDENGKIVRYKARLVVKGFAQVKDRDYHETFSPVIASEALRLLLAVGAAQDLEIKQFDFETAFLNANLEEEVYMRVPEGVNGDGQVCKLLKSLYGLKQAPREWYLLLARELVKLGYKRLDFLDDCVFIKEGKSPIVFGLFVDDGIRMCSNENLKVMEEDFHKLSQRFKVKDLGDIRFMLGMRITRDRSTRKLTIDQESHTKELLNQWDFSQCRTASTPETLSSSIVAYQEIQDKIGPSGKHGRMVLEDYSSVVGALNYLACHTRPDIAHAVNKLARDLASPTEASLIAAKRVLRYLSGSKQLGITYCGSDPTVSAYSDADWAGEASTGKSTSGTLIKIGGGPIAWSSKRQPIVAQSSSEAEYIALNEVGRTLVWISSILKSVSTMEPSIPVIFVDNQTAIKMAQDESHTARRKHINVKYHWIREQVQDGKFKISWIETKEQEADIFTKALPGPQFEILRNKVMGVNFDQSLIQS